jgi:hypothetical protein
MSAKTVQDLFEADDARAIGLERWARAIDECSTHEDVEKLRRLGLRRANGGDE